jgi:hypothetical protein
MRDTIAGCSARGGSIAGYSVPSIRKRTAERASYGSIWMSEAPSRNACVRMAFSRRMIGASSFGFEQIRDMRQLLGELREIDVLP